MNTFVTNAAYNSEMLLEVTRWATDVQSAFSEGYLRSETGKKSVMNFNLTSRSHSQKRNLI